MENQQEHWEKIYSTKRPDEVSWTQEIPKISLDLIHEAEPGKAAHIIDIGGGDSKLSDFLLNEGYEHISVLDISEHALLRAQQRIGEKASAIKWIQSDITDFEPSTSYDLWHDRAAFHFLTTGSQIEKYLSIARAAIKKNGIAIIGTFSTEGPKKCSGLDIHQYDEESLTKAFSKGFEKIKCVYEDHLTPFNTRQNFIFCVFKRI